LPLKISSTFSHALQSNPH